MDKWQFSSGHYIGESHRENQDYVRYFERDGVKAIALSDGCSSSLFATDGARLTVEAVGEVLLSRFDELFALDNAGELMEIVVKEVYNAQKKFVLDSEDVQNKIHAAKAQSLLRNKKTFAEIEAKGETEIMYYYLAELFATLLFVAIKGEKVLLGQVGDGYIGIIADNKIVIKAQETKTKGANPNATFYPTIFETYFRRPEIARLYPDPYKLTTYRRVFKSPNPRSKSPEKKITGFILMSDGNDGLIINDNKGRRLADDVYEIFAGVLNTKTQKEKDELMEAWARKETTTSLSGDDCSIGVLVHDSFKVNKKDGFLYIQPKEVVIPDSNAPVIDFEVSEAGSEIIMTITNLETDKKTDLTINDLDEVVAIIEKFDPDFIKLIGVNKHKENSDIAGVYVEYAIAIRNQIVDGNKFIDKDSIPDHLKRFLISYSRKAFATRFSNDETQ